VVGPQRRCQQVTDVPDSDCLQKQVAPLLVLGNFGGTSDFQVSGLTWLTSDTISAVKLPLARGLAVRMVH